MKRPTISHESCDSCVSLLSVLVSSQGHRGAFRRATWRQASEATRFQWHEALQTRVGLQKAIKKAGKAGKKAAKASKKASKCGLSPCFAWNRSRCAHAVCKFAHQCEHCASYAHKGMNCTGTF